MTRPVFFRPIEATADWTGWTVNDGGGADAVTISPYTYGAWPTFLAKLELALEAAQGGAWTVAFTSNMYVSITADTNWTITWTGKTEIRDALGFAADGLTTTGTNGVATVASMTPSHMWFPTYARTNQSFFDLAQGDVVRGTNSAAGRFAGIGTGSDRHEMRFDFQYEPAANVAEEFASNAYEIERNFETFVYQARAASLTSSSSVDPKGVYVYPDYTDADPVASMATNEGVGYGDSDTHTFCSIKARGGTRSPSASLPSTRQYFNVSMDLISATEPTWNN